MKSKTKQNKSTVTAKQSSNSNDTGRARAREDYFANLFNDELGDGRRPSREEVIDCLRFERDSAFDASEVAGVVRDRQSHFILRVFSEAIRLLEALPTPGLTSETPHTAMHLLTAGDNPETARFQVNSLDFYHAKCLAKQTGTTVPKLLEHALHLGLRTCELELEAWARFGDSKSSQVPKIASVKKILASIAAEASEANAEYLLRLSRALDRVRAGDFE